MANMKQIKQLAYERARATELAAALGNFLVEAQDWKCPKLRAAVESAYGMALNMTGHHTQAIQQLRDAYAGNCTEAGATQNGRARK